jgi:CheY-like chemotaxis protein
MRRRTLLIIDDEPAIAALLKRIGESCGYDAFATSQPEIFKQQFKSITPDVVCLDLVMPDVDGIEILRFLADEQCESQLLIISGFDRQILQSALRLGEALGLKIAGTISKPIPLAALRNLLMQAAQII